MLLSSSGKAKIIIKNNLYFSFVNQSIDFFLLIISYL